MAEYDLSFADVYEDGPPEKPRSQYDLSFADMAPADIAESITQQQATGEAGFEQGTPFPQGQRNDGKPFADQLFNLLPGQDVEDGKKNYWQQLSRAVVGADRQTNATRNLPELAKIGFKGFFGEDANISDLPSAAAFMTTFSPKEQVQILSSKFPEMGVRSDEAGNILLNYKGREAMLNSPGFTGMDAMQLGGTAAAFTPAGRTAAGGTVLGNMGRVGAKSGVTQSALETLQAVSGGSFDPEEVGFSAATGSGAQGILQVIANKIPSPLRRSRPDGKITDDVREVFRVELEKQGIPPESVSDDMIMQALSGQGSDLPPVQAAAVAAEQRFGIPLTAGERTGDPRQLSFEDTVRSSPVAPAGAQRTILDFKEGQANASRQATERVAGEITEGFEGATGGAIRQGVQDAEAIAAQRVRDAYEAVPDAALSIDGMKGLLRNVRRSVVGAEFDRTLPETAKILDAVKGFESLIDDMGDSLRPIDLQKIEQFRRRLNTASGSAESSDKRQIAIMSRQFDDYLDSAVDNALFTGDPAALEMLREARGVSRSYFQRFRANPVKGKSGRTLDSDTAGLNVERIIEANPTDEQVVNYIFGANGINNRFGAQAVRRFREALGSDGVEGWNAIRKEAISRLFKTSDGQISGQKTLTAISDALSKHKTMMGELFTPDEIDQIQQLAVQIKRTQPDFKNTASAENRSNTAAKNAANISTLLTRFGLSMGDLATAGAAGGVNLIVRSSKSGRARQAVRPFEGVYQVRGGVVPAATAGGNQSRQPQ